MEEREQYFSEQTRVQLFIIFVIFHGDIQPKAWGVFLIIIRVLSRSLFERGRCSKLRQNLTQAPLVRSKYTLRDSKEEKFPFKVYFIRKRAFFRQEFSLIEIPRTEFLS